MRLSFLDAKDRGQFGNVWHPEASEVYSARLIRVAYRYMRDKGLRSYEARYVVITMVTGAMPLPSGLKETDRTLRRSTEAFATVRCEGRCGSVPEAHRLTQPSTNPLTTWEAHEFSRTHDYRVARESVECRSWVLELDPIFGEQLSLW